MKTNNWWERDEVIALFIGIVIVAFSVFLPQFQNNNYFEVTARSFLQHGSFFILDYSTQFSELIPTLRGMIIALPPFPIFPAMLGILVHLGELQTTRIGVGIATSLMYLIMRKYKLPKWRAIVASSLYLLTTPLLLFYIETGYWFAAQVWGVVGAQIALLALLNKKYTWAGVGTAIALLSRLNLGAITAVGLTLYIYKTQKVKSLVHYVSPILCGLIVLLSWNYYRFGSILTTGYELIPGVLDEPWYTHGIMHWSYIWTNFKLFLLQNDATGLGLGIIWAQPYLLLLPWLVNRRNAWMILLGLTQFVFVLAHGYVGAFQFDFRFLMDSLWLFVPVLMMSYKGWRQWIIWITFASSAAIHLLLIGGLFR